MTAVDHAYDDPATGTVTVVGRVPPPVEAFVDAVDVARTAAGTVVTLRRVLSRLDGRPA